MISDNFCPTSLFSVPEKEVLSSELDILVLRSQYSYITVSMDLEVNGDGIGFVIIIVVIPSGKGFQYLVAIMVCDSH